jgi:uncharacterized membrane protein
VQVTVHHYVSEVDRAVQKVMDRHTQRSTNSGDVRPVVAAGLMLGLGLGGFVDGIVLHQILQWHHLLTDYGRYSTFREVTVAPLEENTLWDGLFHASRWVLVAAAAFVLWRAGRAPRRAGHLRRRARGRLTI